MRMPESCQELFYALKDMRTGSLPCLTISSWSDIIDYPGSSKFPKFRERLEPTSEASESQQPICWTGLVDATSLRWVALGSVASKFGSEATPFKTNSCTKPKQTHTHTHTPLL